MRSCLEMSRVPQKHVFMADVVGIPKEGWLYLRQKAENALKKCWFFFGMTPTVDLPTYILPFSYSVFEVCTAESEKCIYCISTALRSG